MEYHLKHPVHGFKTTNNSIEAKQDRENGWEDYDPSSPLVSPTPGLPVPSFLGGQASDLPVDFPGRDELIAAGFTTWASVMALADKDLRGVKGIGQATAAKILEALDA